MREKLKKALAGAAAALPTALLLSGAGTVAVGAGLIYLPAGVIALGLLSMAAGVILIRGGGGDG